MPQEGLQKYEEGGPNDHNVIFRGLASSLVIVKEELSPWGWRAYSTEFAERKEVDRKLRALNKLPDSGAEPEDGIIEGTPLWQERLDKMLLVEHLKKKLMKGHGHFGDASELMLKCHHWLVKDPLLADPFVHAITHVPPSQFDRLDLLQERLAQAKKDLRFAREYHEDFLVQLQREREEYVLKVIRNQQIRLEVQAKDDCMVAWMYCTQRNRTLDLQQIRDNLEVRGASLLAGYNALNEEHNESTRQLTEQLEAMTKDRDKFKASYYRMVKAHEQAKADLERTKGTAEGMQNLIMVLTTEKAMLTEQVEKLEDDKRRMVRQLAELRDEVAKCRTVIRFLGNQMRDTEYLLYDVRQDVERLEEVERDLLMKLDATVTESCTLRDELEVSRTETDASQSRLNDTRADLSFEKLIRSSVETVRDGLLINIKGMESELVNTMRSCRDAILKVQEKAAWDLEDFKKRELTKILNDFRKKTDTIIRRNEHLERELNVADTVSKDVGGLAPLAMDDSKVCSICRRFIVYEGDARM